MRKSLTASRRCFKMTSATFITRAEAYHVKLPRHTTRGISTLMYASQQGDVRKVLKIIRTKPSSLYDRDRTGKSPLHYCCTSENISAAQAADYLVMAAPDLMETRDDDGFSPLHLAVIAGNMPLITFLIANNADVNAVDNEKHTVVHWATVCGEISALRVVIAAGAPVSTPDVHGGYPLHYAAQMCGGGKNSNLSLQVLQTLLSHKDIDVRIKDDDGRQPLLWAASAGSTKAILALVRSGANIEDPDKDGLTALHCAASRGHTDCIDSLLTLCGANVDVIDTNGCTALHYAVTLGHADVTALLLVHGADPNRQDRKGRTPAHCGCAKGQFETVKLIAGQGANLWMRNARGDLPLHEAVSSGRRELVKWLLEMRPSQVNARNNDGRCLLHLAAMNDNADMCKILLDVGAKINPVLRTSKNVFMTPLDCALQKGHRSTAKYLQLQGGVPASRLGVIPQQFFSNTPANFQKEMTHLWHDSSSESDEAEKVIKHRSTKRKVSKFERKRASLTGSDDYENVKSLNKLDNEKNAKKTTDKNINCKTEEKHATSSTRIDYTNEIIINGRTEINIHDTKEITMGSGETRIVSENNVIKRPKTATIRKQMLNRNDQSTSTSDIISSNIEKIEDDQILEKLIGDGTPQEKKTVKIVTVEDKANLPEKVITSPEVADSKKMDEETKAVVNKCDDKENINEKDDENKELRQSDLQKENNEKESKIIDKQNETSEELLENVKHTENVSKEEVESQRKSEERQEENDESLEINCKTTIERKTQETSKQNKNEETVELNEKKISEKEESEKLATATKRREKDEESQKEHKSFRVLDESETNEICIKEKKIKKQRSRSEDNNKVVTKKQEKSSGRYTTVQSSKTDKHLLNIPDRKIKSSLESSRIPSLPNIHEARISRDHQVRSVSNMSAPNLIYNSDSESYLEKEESKRKRRRVKRRTKTRDAKSAGSDYESSNVIDSGFEPSPRSTQIPKWRNMSERGVNMTSVTQSIQANIRRYHLERQIFQHLLELKRLQIRAGQHNEAVLVKRAINAYHESCASTVGAGRYVPDDFTFKSFEKFLYHSLRKLQKNGEFLKGLPESPNPVQCTRSTHRCMHAIHAYTGIPCAAYLPKMDHHTIPKIGFDVCKSGTGGFLPSINTKKAVTLELCHGGDKQIISLPTDRLDQNKRYYVTFTVKGNELPSGNEEQTGHRHSKSY